MTFNHGDLCATELGADTESIEVGVGQPGGSGARGERGGIGADAQEGSRCQLYEGQPGGRGKRGGNAGAGGSGGPGGAAGRISVVSARTFASEPALVSRPGNGGVGGEHGRAGAGGEPGIGGHAMGCFIGDDHYNRGYNWFRARRNPETLGYGEPGAELSLPRPDGAPGQGADAPALLVAAAGVGGTAPLPLVDLLLDAAESAQFGGDIDLALEQLLWVELLTRTPTQTPVRVVEPPALRWSASRNALTQRQLAVERLRQLARGLDMYGSPPSHVTLLSPDWLRPETREEIDTARTLERSHARYMEASQRERREEL